MSRRQPPPQAGFGVASGRRYPFFVKWSLLMPLDRKKELLQGVYAMGFNRPSKIQETALPMMLAHP